MCTCNQSWKTNEALKSSLDKERFNAQQGFLREIKIQIPGVYSLSGYNFLNGDAPLTVHDNLWEQAKLNMNVGLYRVNRVDDHDPFGRFEKYNVQKGDVFQLRGCDRANMTIVYDGAGWIVMDVLTTMETAQAAWTDIVQKYLSDDPINMAVYSHSHIDHYGGIGGLIKYFAPNCSIIAPEGFTRHAITENIYAGTAMSRHKPADRATKYVAAFGADAILKVAQRANVRRDYAWAAELLDYLVNADDSTELDMVRSEAVKAYRFALKRMGYQSEASSWRNMYLTGARELEKPYRSGQHLYFPEDTVNAMDLEMILQYMGIILDSKAVERDAYRRRINVTVTYTDRSGTNRGEYSAAYVHRGILGYRITSAPPDPDDFPKDIPVKEGAEIKIAGTKLDFFRAFVDHDGAALKALNVTGDAAGLIDYLTRFTIDFPIMTPRGAYGAAAVNPD